ncbi:MAG: polyprenyl synthetase family protein [bacterium]|nr:polyprenyl synthetase family protein [bacterium]
MIKNNITSYLEAKRRLVDKALKKNLPKLSEYPPIIHEAMHYSVFSGGKRIRPVLSMAVYELFDPDPKKILNFASAIEFIHTYSLIHDDLPCMDNDDYRRGKLSCHKKFGEDIALLAGDALLTLAFEVLSCTDKKNFSSEKVLEVITEVSRAVGTKGMIGGQVVDCRTKMKGIDVPLLQYIHIHKTGEFFLAAVKAGAILGGANKDEYLCLSRFGENIGLAFQIVDDILDKDTDNILEKSKITYPAVFGESGSRKRARDLIDTAKKQLEIFEEKGEILQNIAEYIIQKVK